MSTPAHPPQRGPRSGPRWQELAEVLWLAAHIASTVPPERPKAASPPKPPQGRPRTPPQTRGDGRPPLPETPPPELPEDHQPVRLIPWPKGAAPPVPAVLADTAPSRTFLKALRPFRLTSATSHRPPEMDEVATAEQAADGGLWLPVLREARERMLDLDVVLDDGQCARLHRAEGLRLVSALTAAGAFRRIRVHLLDTDVKTQDELRLTALGGGSIALPATALALPAHTGRRLIVIFTDGVGDAWHSGAATRLLARWGQGNAVCVIHALPARLWRRTGVPAVRADLRTPGVAAPSARYGQAAGEVMVPVIEAEPCQIETWAEFVVAARTQWRGAAVSCSPQEAPPYEEGEDDHEQPSAEEQVRRFRMDVTPTTFHLGVLLAAAPLNPEVMSLVRRALLPRSSGAHMTELLGSGLIKRADSPAAELPITGGVPFDFQPGVREELLQAGRRSETARVLMAVADHLAPDIRELGELRHVIASPSSADMPELPERLAPILAPTLSAMEAMSGPYTKPARALRSALFTDHHDRSEDPSDGHAPTGEPGEPGPAAGVYAHVTKDRPEQDNFGVSVNMSATPSRTRLSNEPTPVWNVPQKNQSFTGREELLHLLHERLSTGTTAVLPEALHGLGGVGKSQIAIEYCYRHQEDYDLIWWISAERLHVVRQAFVDLATHLNLDVGEPNVAVPAVKEALRLGRPFANWLLVFDNAEDVEEIRRFFPTNGPGKIMITSRSRAWFSYAAKLEVDVFQREESRELLRKRGPALTDSDADQLAERLGDLPLAIEQAAVWLNESGMPFEEYLRLFDGKRDELLTVEGSFTPVAVAWNISFEQLRRSHPAALQLLQVCSYLAPEPIPRSLLTSSRDLKGPAELVQTMRDPIELARTTRAINQYALGKMNHRDNTFSLHRLVQRVVQSQLSPDEAKVIRQCGHMLLANADPKNPRDRTRWPEYQALVPHIYSAKLEESDDPWARNLVINIIDYLFLWGDNDAFLAMAEKVWETWTNDLGSDHDSTLAAELRLGRALVMSVRFEDALQHHLHARDALREKLGPDHERTLEAEGYLAIVLRFLGRFSEALEIDQRSYETLVRRFGPDDPLSLEQAHLLAIDLRLSGDPDKARELDEETYGRKEEVLGPDSLSTLSSRAALAIDEMECGRYVEARELQVEHADALVRRYGKSHPGAMAGIAILSVMNRKAGRHDEALKGSEEARNLYMARYGEKDQETVAITLNHAVNLRHTGDLKKSVEIGRQAKQFYAEIFGVDHPNTPVADVNLAVSLRLSGRVEEALELDESALAQFDRLLGTDHPRALLCAVNLASDLAALGRHEEALARDRDTLQRLRDNQGDNHPTTLACQLNLGLDLEAMGQVEESHAHVADAIRRYRQVLNEDHPAILSAVQGKRANCDIYPIPL
ncbi:FxSxx-COOH system tetratricopeptide repeat protein [Nonomuraea typhae]|uniref:FxSxx-COOH system tetratricopeptide repeat protein n=1 Tax=Nonomuraea typhae TaxID=2603600 RepID=A0ABW7ZEI3_9ACTN